MAWRLEGTLSFRWKVHSRRRQEWSLAETKKCQASKNKASQPARNFTDVDPYFIESTAITTSHGPSSITRNITQDQAGNIWLATWEGILRYDGSSFTNVTNQYGLRRFGVFTILEDSEGSIWFGTVGAGVYKYDGKLFNNFTTQDGLADDRVGCIYEDDAGNIWFGTVGGASRFDGTTFQNFTTKEGLTDNDINSIMQDETGKIWFGTRGDVCRYDGEKFTKLTNQQGTSFENVGSIIKDKTGNIWLGGNEGLWRFDGQTFVRLFSKNFVGYVYQDRQGNVWTSSDGRVDQEQPNPHQWLLSRYDQPAPGSGEAIAPRIRNRKECFWDSGR